MNRHRISVAMGLWCAVWCAATLPLVLSAPSTLKVAACNPGSVPYVNLVNGTFVGYDIDIWNIAYDILMQRVAAAKDNPALYPGITQQVQDLVGTRPPTLMKMSSNAIQAALAAKTIDVGMCGFIVTIARMELFDFTDPFYFATSLQAAVPKPVQQPTIIDVLNGLAGTIDAKAQLITVLLMLFVFAFGHLVAAAENFRFGPPGSFRDNYFEATQDGMWFSIIVMSTVGLGDIAPKTFLGRLLSVIWIIVSIALMAILFAIITSNFGSLVLIPTLPEYAITGIDNLGGFQVGTAQQYAQSILTQHIPDINLTKFPTNAQPTAFRSLLNGTVGVVVDRAEVIQYYNNFVPEFQDRLMAIGAVFGQEGIAFGVARPSPAAPHPIYDALSSAVADAVQTRWADQQAAQLRWFGRPPSASQSDASFLITSLQTSAVLRVRNNAGVVLLSIAVIWAFLAIVSIIIRYPYYDARNQVYSAIRTAVSIELGEAVPNSTRSVSYNLIKDRVIMGLAQLQKTMHAAPGDEANITPDQVEAAVFSGSLRNRLKPAMTFKNATKYERRDMNVQTFINYFAAKLVRDNPPGRRWMRLAVFNFESKGRDLIKSMFFSSYAEVQEFIEEWKPASEDMDLCLDDVADVVLNLLSKEQRSLFREGGLIFPHRTGANDHADPERHFDRLAREIRAVEGKLAASHAKIDDVELLCAKVVPAGGAGGAGGAGRMRNGH